MDEKVKVYNSELTKEEIKRVEEAARNIGSYGTVEIVKNGSTVDIIESKRIRIRDGKRYHQG